MEIFVRAGFEANGAPSHEIVDCLTPPKIVFKTLTPLPIVGKTLLLAMDGLTVVPQLFS